MPEGPSIILVREAVKVLASGYYWEKVSWKKNAGVTKGIGTSFYFSLPVKKAEKTNSEPTAEA